MKMKEQPLQSTELQSLPPNSIKLSLGVNHPSNQSNNSAQDTIYLCNFRVSVDGDWLCLRQLEDVEVPLRRPIYETLPSPDFLPFYGIPSSIIYIHHSYD